MDNPWLRLPEKEPFILAGDFAIFRKNNIDLIKIGVHPEILPVPYLGDFNKASIVLLCLNPGYNKTLDDLAYSDKDYLNQSMKSLIFSSDPPFYCLDERFSFTGGYIWWKKILKYLIKIFENKKISQELICIQYFPYHSKKYYHLPFTLPSQYYSFYLVKQAIKKNKVIIIMRSKKLWLKAVPELKEYNYIELKNFRRPYLTKNNLINKSDYIKIIKALR